MTPSVVDPPHDVDPATGVAGVVLAAGTSSRFGDENKLLAEVDGIPVVRRSVSTLVAAPVDPVIVVVGHEADRVREALAELAVETVENPAFREGQATSVRTGIQAVPDRCGAAVVALGDMPFIATESVLALLRAYEAGRGDALAAAYQGERGNPVLFDRRYFAALADLEGDIGGRELLRREGTLVETGDPGVRRDIDRPDEVPTGDH